MSSRFEQAYRVDGGTKLTATLWNRIFRELDTRLVSIEEKKASFEEAERQLLQIGLNRINEALLPAAERIFRVAELGFLVASSDEEATFVEGQEASLTIREGDQRELFTPTEFVAISRRSTPEDWVIARTLGYSRESGVLLVRAEVVKGSGGPHDDWDVSATPGAAQAVVDLFEQVSSLRQEVADDKAAVAIDKAAAQSARTEAQNARDAAIIAKTGAESALASFMTVYRGALPSAPPDGEQGHFYFDTTLQQVRVRTASGWISLAESYTKTESDERYIQPDSNGKIPKDKLPSLARRVGEFFWYFGATPPSYALVCDGSTISRTTYADLWAFAQASGNLAASEGVKGAGQFGPGNGTTTFTLPDLTTGAEFIRAVTIGRGIGTWQTGALQSHTHTLPAKVMLGEQSSSGFNSGVSGGDGSYSKVGTVGDSTPGAPNVGSTGGTETRPRNIALLPCIVF